MTSSCGLTTPYKIIPIVASLEEERNELLHTKIFDTVTLALKRRKKACADEHLLEAFPL